MAITYDFGNDSSAACLIKIRNNTIITNLYGGIPETLILNVIGWIIFILLFSVLRQQAWDYGRLALVHSNTGDKKRWTQLFYAHGTDVESATTRNSSAPIDHRGGEPHSSSSPPPPSTSTGITASSPAPMSPMSSTGSQTTSSSPVDRGFFSWIPVTFRLKKEQILLHSGPDAVHYLSFQQHLIFVMAIITFISIVIILPVNYQGDLSGDTNSLGHTTISNLNPKSPLLWIHVFVAIFYVPLVVLVMRRASGRNAFKTASTRTIMATNISQADCNRQIIRNYVKELFPDVHIEDIQLAYNIARLTEVVDEYEKTVEARIYCELHRSGRGPVMASPSCFTCTTIDALEYYQERESQLSGEVARLRASALNDPLGIAFITVSTPIAAKNIIMHFKPGTYREWTLSYAPAPSDIFWEHLNVGAGHWYVKWALVNFCLFLFLFFLTTPIYIVNLLDTWSLTKHTTDTIGKVTPLISEFLPTLLLWILAALMPVAVSFSDKWLSHWTRSRQNYSIMTKSFGYLLFMILILPSLGLTSAQALLQWTLHYNDEDSQFRWDCIFLPDKGAFFVNYVITAAFIGTSLELLRFADLIVYIWELCTAKSRAETPHIRRSILTEFPFGIHYAWTVMLFTMSTVYSVVCPLIMPFAMVYICLKHFGDRHNLYFAYGPSDMISQGGGRIHSTAVTMTKFAVILLLVILAALASVRGAGLDARAIILIITLFATLTLFMFMSPIKKCTTKPPSIQENEGPTPVYMPKVLMQASRRITAAEISSHLGYGSDSPPVVEIIDDRRSGGGGGDGGDGRRRQRGDYNDDGDDEIRPIRNSGVDV